MPERLEGEIRRQLQRLELVLKMIRALEAERDAIVTDAAPVQLNADKIRQLNKLRALGPELATVLVGEVFYRSFNNRRQVGSYVGFPPTPFRSGAMAREQGISKAGNAKARRTMIELAWLWLRYQPDSASSIWLPRTGGWRRQRHRCVRLRASVAVRRRRRSRRCVPGRPAALDPVPGLRAS